MYAPGERHGLWAEHNDQGLPGLLPSRAFYLHERSEVFVDFIGNAVAIVATLPLCENHRIVGIDIELHRHTVVGDVKPPRDAWHRELSMVVEVVPLSSVGNLPAQKLQDAPLLPPTAAAKPPHSFHDSRIGRDPRHKIIQ